jgi:hypothetical protein
LDAKYGPFDWICQQDETPVHTSQGALEWPEERADVILDWPANSPGLSPIEVLWAVHKTLVKQFDPQNMEERKSAAAAACALIPQATIDSLSRGFQTPLQICLAKRGESISNDFWQTSERHALKVFWLGTSSILRGPKSRTKS